MSNVSSNLNTAARRQFGPRRLALLALLASIFLYFGAQLFGGVIVSMYPAFHHWNAAQTQDWLSSSIWAQFSFALLADGLLVAGVAAMLRYFRWSWATIGLTVPKVWHITVGLLAVVPYYLIYMVVVAVISALIPELNINQKQDIGFQTAQGTVPLVLTFISLVVLPPLAEEIITRGFLYTGLRRWLPKVAAALAVSCLFGAAHLAEGGSAGPLWIGAIDTFILSLVLVFLREKTGNLWAGITLHAIKNGLAFAILYLWPHLV